MQAGDPFCEPTGWLTPSASPRSGGSCWSDYGLSTLQPSPRLSLGSSSWNSGSMDVSDPLAQLTPIIKAGWLDKNPPQG